MLQQNNFYYLKPEAASEGVPDSEDILKNMKAATRTVLEKRYS